MSSRSAESFGTTGSRYTMRRLESEYNRKVRADGLASPNKFVRVKKH